MFKGHFWSHCQRRFFAAISFGLLLFASMSHADPYFIDQVQGPGIGESDLATVHELVVMATSQEKGQKVVESIKEAEFVLKPKLMKLGDSYLLSVEKRDRKGQLVFAEKMKAKEMSDMDNVTSRVVKAVILGVSSQVTADVTNVTRDEETQNTRRYQATRQWIIGLGPGWTSNLKSKGGGFTFQLGYLWGLDPDFGVNLSWTAHSGPTDDDSTFSDFSIGGEYYLARTKTSPFFGARLGYGSGVSNKCSFLSLNCTEDRASGWSTNVTAGYKFFRTSSVNVGVTLNYFYLFNRTSVGNPNLTSLQFVVYY